jgi:2-polyprenyl-6-methoxyphenol hydroxylase-like FAD-dependent oxidoreductase
MRKKASPAQAGQARKTHRCATIACMKKHALIIGGSLGGLFAANLLRKAGWDVSVFERVENDLASRGAGIGTHEELLLALRRLGLPADGSMGIALDERICLDSEGRLVHTERMSQFMSAWARVYRLLKDALPAEHYHFGMGLSRVEQEPGRVTARFADGTTATGDLLVAADGIRSTVRAQLLPSAQPRYAGYVAWRGLLDEWDVPPEIHAEIFEKYTFGLPEGELLHAYPVPGRNNETRRGSRGYNIIWYRPVEPLRALPDLCTDASGKVHGTAIPPPLIRPEVIAGIKADGRALLAPQISDIWDRMQPFFQSIFDLESERIVFGRVALLGDAAFVARPHVGMGVTKAALDAQGLAAALTECGDIEAALERYDRERRDFGTRIVARARRLGAYLEAQNKPYEQRTEAERHRTTEKVMQETGAPLIDMRELMA